MGWRAVLVQEREYQYFSVNNTLLQNLEQIDGNPQIWNEDRTYAAFGQLTYSLTDTLAVHRRPALLGEQQGRAWLQLLGRRRRRRVLHLLAHLAAA